MTKAELGFRIACAAGLFAVAYLGNVIRRGCYLEVKPTKNRNHVEDYRVWLGCSVPANNWGLFFKTSTDFYASLRMTGRFAHMYGSIWNDGHGLSTAVGIYDLRADDYCLRSTNKEGCTQ